MEQDKKFFWPNMEQDKKFSSHDMERDNKLFCFPKFPFPGPVV